MDREPPKGLKWPAEGLHYTWGLTRGSGHIRVPLGEDCIPIGLGPLGVEPGDRFDTWQLQC